MGFYRRDSHDIVNIKTCHLQHELSNRFMAELSSLLSELRWSVYNEKTDSGLLKHVITKVSFSENELLCIMVTKEEKLPEIDKFISKLKDFPRLVGIVRNINKEKSNVIMGNKNILLTGRDYIIEEIKGIKFKITPSSFFQVNICQLETMYDVISRLVSPLELNTVIDAFCGVGTFSMFLSNKAKHIVGIEENPEAVKMAVENGKLNNFSNVAFHEGKVEDVMYDISKKEAIDLIVIDPPRKGCEKKFLEDIEKLGIKHIIYISCNPATLGRDLAILKEMGYETKSIEPIDMFPHTPHVECVAYIKKLNL
jgi:23S rRNA (uracil1939-C5)-methyltransferase